MNDIGNLFQRKGGYQKALKLDPKFAGVWFNLAFLYQKMGRRRKALEAAQKFLKLTKKKKGTKLEYFFRKQIEKNIIKGVFEGT